MMAKRLRSASEAVSAWKKGTAGVPKPKKRVHPILPIEGEKNVLITAALPYVNNVPHLGNLIGCVLSADVFSRFCRLRNYNTLYISGTDEYGTATETMAIKKRMTPEELCAENKAKHEEVYNWFNIDFDYFGKTSTPQQTIIAQDIFWRLHKRGFIDGKPVDQLFCERCSIFLLDRFVEGTCPQCSYDKARGDQCEKCGKLINPIELKKPCCKLCSSESHIRASSNNLFLDLSKSQMSAAQMWKYIGIRLELAGDVVKWSEGSMQEGIWSANSCSITSTWLKEGLKPSSISRDLKWGTQIPLEGYTDKVFYGWFDAPIGYLSITACYMDEWQKWWKNPSQVTLHQFMGKDSVPFHTVVFPATLMGADDNYTLLNVMSATEYLTYEGEKFSKSRGVGVFGDDAQECSIPADIFRFYLLYIRPETQDTAFSWNDLMLKHNTELLNNFGNFIYRALTFLKKSFDSTVPLMDLAPEDEELVARVAKELSAFNEGLDNMKLRDGLNHILNISRLGNGHIQATEPWELLKGSSAEKARAGTVIGLCANIACLLSVMIQPYMPATSQQIQEQLQAPPDCNVLIIDSFRPFLSPGHVIGNPSPLFTKIEPERAAELRSGKYSEQAKVQSASKEGEQK